MKVSACRDRMVSNGIRTLLGVGASTSAMDALSNDEKMNLIYVVSLNEPFLSVNGKIISKLRFP